MCVSLFTTNPAVQHVYNNGQVSIETLCIEYVKEIVNDSTHLFNIRYSFKKAI